MNDHSKEQDVDAHPKNEREVPIDGDSVSLYRQPGGCLEISQFDEIEGQDLVHICLDAIPLFLTELIRFVLDTGGDS